jgi:hypothetical protein
LGRGYWHESDLLEPILPVTLRGFDLSPVGMGKPALVTPVLGVISGKEEWTEKPAVVWLHKLKAKVGAQTHMRVGDHPALVTWQAGKGRVAVLALTPLGEEQENILVWWKWTGWTGVMENTARWLLKAAAR